MVQHKPSHIGHVNNLVGNYHIHFCSAQEVYKTATEDETVHAELLVRKEEGNSVVQEVTSEEEEGNSIPSTASAAFCSGFT